MGTLRHFSPHMMHCGTSNTDTDCPFACGINFEPLHQGDHAYQQRFTCVTQLIRQRRSVTCGGVTALHRSAASIRC
jgi:hypothetical protein